VLTKALTDVREALGREYWDQYAGLDETRDILDAALKPAEPPLPEGWYGVDCEENNREPGITVRFGSGTEISSYGKSILSALKPAEGGGDEYRKSCEAAHKALSMGNQRITPCNPDANEAPCSACFVRGCNGECMENL